MTSAQFSAAALPSVNQESTWWNENNDSLSFSNRLVDLYKERRFSEMEVLAKVYTERFKEDSFGWECLAIALKNQKKYIAANDAYSIALKLSPHSPSTLSNFAHCLNEQGRYEDALSCAEQAAQYAPNYIGAWVNRGAAQLCLSRTKDAATSFEQALSLDPDHAEAHYNLGLIFLHNTSYADAVSHFLKALAAQPNYPAALAGLANAYAGEGDTDKALDYFRKANSYRKNPLAIWQEKLLLPAIPSSVEVLEFWRERYHSGIRSLLQDELPIDEKIQNLGSSSFYLAYQGKNDLNIMRAQSDLLRCKVPGLNYVAKHIENWVPPGFSKRIRIGFLSQFLVGHTIGKLNQGFLRHLDRKRFEIVLLHAPGVKLDVFSAELESLAAKTVVLPLPLVAQQEIVASLRLDVLFYPDIGMSWDTLLLAHARLAPVQVLSWGHPVTSGISTLDYFVSATDIEPEEADSHYSERLIRLNRLPCFYQPLIIPVEVPSRAELGLPEDGVLYGCPQSLFKFHPDFDTVLEQIALKDPTGHIVLLEGKEKNWSSLLRKRWEKYAPKLGERVCFLSRQSQERFMALMAHFDVLLDPVHFGGGNTLYEAMVYGTPIVTWPGNFMRGRVVAGAYQQMGVTDKPLVHNLSDYASLAVSLGRDAVRRDALRNELREKCTAIFSDINAVRELELFIEAAVDAAGRGEKLPENWKPQTVVDTGSEGTQKPEVSGTLVNGKAFETLRQLATMGRFYELARLSEQLRISGADDASSLIDLGALLSDYGFLTDARTCYEKAQALAPTDLRTTINLANIARDAGEHSEARRLYAQLLQALPDHLVVRRNALTSLEYDPEVPDAERLAQAKAWGAWAIVRAGGIRPRPALQPLQGRPLRLGYVSADLCQHTVGLFVKGVLKTHDSARVQVFAYSAGQVKDWVTNEIRAVCIYRDVASLDDAALAEQIRADGIDVLVDLSGHTAGSRLTAFAHRPAPVMVSWLGYFATTGLPCMDAVLLDEWHAPPGTEAQFVEPILRLPSGRFCYQPVPWAPTEVAVPAFAHNGHITFGCFNNTAKFNAGVFDLWARILDAVPRSRLVLKWRTFNDEAFKHKVTQAFVDRGIASDRIELCGPSFHADLLKEYADIDIALDPFPFTGGLTSCEALWMGVPVVTWPQSRVVSRQTHAFLHQIGLPELSAKDADDYVRVAVELANDWERLVELRATLRERMRASPLMDVAGFTRQIEDTLIDLYRRIEAEESHKSMHAKTILHVGPGHRNNGAKLPAAFQGSDWQEIRLDIDPGNDPDIVGSMLEMAAVGDASVDAIYSAHNIEHVYAHEVPQVLKEFLRVLKPDGFLVVTCPDLQTVCQLVAEDKLNEAAYTSQAGPITPLDILYGHGAALAAGHHYMAHKCGFTLKTLTQVLHTAGFATSAGKRRLRGLDLWVVASKGPMEEAALRELAGKVLPA